MKFGALAYPRTAMKTTARTCLGPTTVFAKMTAGLAANAYRVLPAMAALASLPTNALPLTTAPLTTLTPTLPHTTASMAVAVMGLVMALVMALVMGRATRMGFKRARESE